ncbi:Alkane hydroxylase MAH1 [Vitis vinifera]|uniref:Alkane hydroxylase MAH1 n=1 Tax=Vitis vinifera TaxID=29760 RepID=A0A438KK82_VITVI|nr:Alkane hydroxylase MAH1 [Vitis vinifera]
MALVSYPEILVAVIFFLFIGGFCSKKGVPWNWPIVGMFAGLLFHVHRIHDEAAEILEKTGCTFLFKGPWFCNMDMLGTTDPANVHYIMSSNFSNFPKGTEFRKMFEVLGDGIFNADGESWRNQRKLGQSMINNPRFHRFLAKVTYNKVEKGLVPLLDHLSEQGRVVDLQDVFQRLTFDTTCMLVTGFDTKCLSIEFPEVPFATALEDVEEAVFYRHALPETLGDY